MIPGENQEGFLLTHDFGLATFTQVTEKIEHNLAFVLIAFAKGMQVSHARSIWEE